MAFTRKPRPVPFKRSCSESYRQETGPSGPERIVFVDLGLSEVDFANKTIPKDPWCWNIYLLIGIIWKITLGVNVGKYSSTMDPLGMVWLRFYETSHRSSEWLHGTIWRGFENWKVRSYPRFHHQKTRGNYDRHQLSITRKSPSLPSPPCGDAKTHPSRSCQVGSSVNSWNLPFSF